MSLPDSLAPETGWRGTAAPPYVAEIRRETARVQLRTLSWARKAAPDNAPVAIAVMRDEAGHLREWLAHYRRLGIRRFAIIDHGSRDATVPILRAQRDVDLYGVTGPFYLKHAWINRLIGHYGYDRWYLHVDADEYLVFDGAPGRPLPEVVAFAEEAGLRRVRGMLIDMYAPGPVLHRRAGRACLRTAYPYFDATGYVEERVTERVSRKGGPRRRKFRTCSAEFDPELTKYPLFHLRAGEVALTPHHLYPYEENARSDCFLGLLHYKFTDRLPQKARHAVHEENYWRKSLEYKSYLDVLSRTPDLHLVYEGSRVYRTPADLVEAGLIAPMPFRPRRFGARLSRGVLGLRRLGEMAAGMLRPDPTKACNMRPGPSHSLLQKRQSRGAGGSLHVTREKF